MDWKEMKKNPEALKKLHKALYECQEAVWSVLDQGSGISIEASYGFVVFTMEPEQAEKMAQYLREAKRLKKG